MSDPGSSFRRPAGAPQPYDVLAEMQKVRAKHPPIPLALAEVPAVDDRPSADEGEVREPLAPLYKAATALLPAPQTWSDEVLLAAQVSPVTGAQILLGDHYDHYVALGGSATILFQMVQNITGATVGESQASGRS